MVVAPPLAIQSVCSDAAIDFDAAFVVVVVGVVVVVVVAVVLVVVVVVNRNELDHVKKQVGRVTWCLDLRSRNSSAIDQ